MPVCMGCYLNQTVLPFHSTRIGDYYHSCTLFPPQTENGLTAEEKNVLFLLAEAWGKFKEMASERDAKDFLDSIHDCQRLVALRVARRVDPEIWIQE